MHRAASYLGTLKHLGVGFEILKAAVTSAGGGRGLTNKGGTLTDGFRSKLSSKVAIGWETSSGHQVVDGNVMLTNSKSRGQPCLVEIGGEAKKTAHFSEARKLLDNKGLPSALQSMRLPNDDHGQERNLVRGTLKVVAGVNFNSTSPSGLFTSCGNLKRNLNNMFMRNSIRFFCSGGGNYPQPSPLDRSEWNYLHSHVSGDPPPQSIRADDPRRLARDLVSSPGLCFETGLDETKYFYSYHPTDYAQVMTLFNLVDIPGCVDINGVWLDKKIWVPTDSCLHSLRSIACLVRSFHQQKKCFANLALDTTILTCGGEFRVNEKLIAFTKFNKDNARADWKMAAAMGKQFIRCSRNGKIIVFEQDIEDWFKLMESNESVYMEYLICTNLALLPLANRGHAFVRMFDKTIISPNLHVLLAYISWFFRWQISVGCNIYIKQWLQYRRYASGAKGLIIFIRNSYSHKCSHLLLGKLVDFLLYAHYPALPCELQKALNDKSELKDLGLEQLFPGKGVFSLKFDEELFKKTTP